MTRGKVVRPVSEPARGSQKLEGQKVRGQKVREQKVRGQKGGRQSEQGSGCQELFSLKADIDFELGQCNEHRAGSAGGGSRK